MTRASSKVVDRLWTEGGLSTDSLHGRTIIGLGIALYIGVNLGLILYMPERPGEQNVDWQLWLALDPANGRYYDLGSAYPFVWSPIAAWIMAGVTWLGYWPWFALHLASLWLLRFSPMLMLLTASSWGFYMDTVQGNTFAFVFVAGVLALRGSRAWALVYVGLLCLMPRPVQVPLALWLIWTMPAIRWPAVGIVAINAALVLASGLLPEWIAAALSYTWQGYNLGPTALIGAVWLAIGLPLGAWLTWKGHVEWAGLAISPYVMPQYLLAPLWRRWPESR